MNLKLSKLLITNGNFIAVINSFLVVIALYCYYFYSGNISQWLKNPIGSDVFWVVLGGIFWFLFKNSFPYYSIYTKFSTIAIATIFSLSIVIGRAMTITGNLSLYTTTTGFLLFMVMIFGFTILFTSIIVLIYRCLDENSIVNQEGHWLYSNPKKTFYIIWFIIATIYLFYLFLLFPGVIAYDSVFEMNQFKTGVYTDHHPFIHVFIVHSFMQLSLWFGGSLTTSIFMYSLTQLLCMSGIFAYGLYFLIKFDIHKKVILFLFILFAIIPVHAVYSITMFKDVLFSGFCLLIVLQLIDLIYTTRTIKNNSFFIRLGLLLFLFATFRHNGWYAFVLTAPIILLAFKIYRKKVALMLFMVFGLITLYNSILLPAFDVKKGALRESLSIPLQQIARTVKFNSATLSLKEKKAIREILVTDSLASLYQPNSSDNVKATFDEQAYKRNPKKFHQLYFDLMFKYPQTYLESLLAGTYGYIDPAVNYGGAYYFYTISDYEYNYFSFLSNDTKSKSEISKNSLFLSLPKYVLIHIPIISLLTSIGFMIWFALLIIVRLIHKKRYILLVPFYFLACLYATILASPINGDYRYAYGIVISIPFLCSLALLDSFKLIANADEAH